MPSRLGECTLGADFRGIYSAFYSSEPRGVSRAFSALRLAEDWSPGAIFCRARSLKNKPTFKARLYAVSMLSWPKHKAIHSTLQRVTRAHMWRIKRME